MLNVCIKNPFESNDLLCMFRMIIMMNTHTILPPKTLILLSEVCCSYYIKIPKSSPLFVISQKDKWVQRTKEMMKDIIVVLEWVAEEVWLIVVG